MSNEEIREEILFFAHKLGIIEEFISRISKQIPIGERTSTYLKEFEKIIKEKNLKNPFKNDDETLL